VAAVPLIRKVKRPSRVFTPVATYVPVGSHKPTTMNWALGRDGGDEVSGIC
jgi:hypothetical protein